MPNYCANDDALESGEHIVHRLDTECPFVPSGENRYDLGMLSDDEEAMSKAAGKYDRVDGCPECMEGHNNHATKQEIDASIAALITAINM